jgi:hypothetical protein
MVAVSPWQFKNLPDDAWVELSDTLIKYRWEQAINTVKPDIVEIVTWNDYGECELAIRADRTRVLTMPQRTISRISIPRSTSETMRRTT